MVNYKKVLMAYLLLMSGVVYADLSSVEPYRGAQLVKSGSEVNPLIEVPLAKIRRSGRGWEPESVLRVSGEKSHSLYKINRNEPLDKVLSYYQSALLGSGRSLLFKCESRSCGSSNAWANDFFDEYLLYGADDNQLLMSLQDGEGNYQVIYINRRGAGDIMVRIDTITTKSAKNTDADVAAQFEVQDTPRIRRFLNGVPTDRQVIGYVTSKPADGYSALARGDQSIDKLNAAIGARLQLKVRFVNIADMGLEALGYDRVSFVYVLP